MRMMKQENNYPKECDGCCQRITCDHNLEKCCYLSNNRCLINEYKNNFIIKEGG